MSLYRRFVADFSGLNKIRREASAEVPSDIDAHYHLRPTDHSSKGQVVVAKVADPATDALSSQELEKRTQQAVEAIHRLAR